MCQFRISKVIISDNAKQFDKIFCLDLVISHHSSPPGHAQANGQVKVTNRIILRNLKARLEKSKSKWAKDLSGIPYNEQNPYGRDVVFYGIWDKVGYTSGDRNAEL